MTGRAITRVLAATAIVAALALAATAFFSGAGDYRVRALFPDAGQLVKGDLVEVGGRSIGTITALRLTSDNQAEVELAIEDGRYIPLRRGTVARIRAVGLSGVANRFVDIEPGRGAEIGEGGVLTQQETEPIVDLDAMLQSFDRPTRNRLASLLRAGASALDDGRAEDANQALRFANPAVAQTRALAEEVVRDRAALSTLVSASADVAGAVSSRSRDVEEGITNTAGTLAALSRERAAMERLLAQAPATLRQASGTLSRTRSALRELRPALRDARPVAEPLARVLRDVVPVSRAARPVVADLRALLPDLRRALLGAPPLERTATPALKSTDRALRTALPVVAALRAYAPDVVTGFFNGLAGTTGGYYDANGHFARISPHFGQLAVNGPGQLFPPFNAADFHGYRTGLVARCPGGAASPAADKSNPWRPPEAPCDPEDDQP